MATSFCSQLDHREVHGNLSSFLWVWREPLTPLELQTRRQPPEPLRLLLPSYTQKWVMRIGTVFTNLSDDRLRLEKIEPEHRQN